MQIFGSITAIKNMLSQGNLIVGSAGGTATSPTVSLVSGDASGGTSGVVTVASGLGTTATGSLVLGSGNASAGNSGGVAIASGTATGTRGTLTLGGSTIGATAVTTMTLTAPTSVTLTTPSVVLSATPTISAATSLTLSSASHILTQGSYSATLVVPASATITFPSVTSTLATLAGTEILTNKLVRGSGIAPQYSGSATYAIGDLVTSTDGLTTYAALAAGTLGALTTVAQWRPVVQNGLGTVTDDNGTTPSCDGQTGNVFSLTLSGSGTITLDHMRDGAVYNIYVSGAASRTVAWDTKDQDNTGLTERYSPTYSTTMTTAISIFTLMRIGTNVVVNSLHGIA